MDSSLFKVFKYGFWQIFGWLEHHELVGQSLVSNFFDIWPGPPFLLLLLGSAPARHVPAGAPPHPGARACPVCDGHAASNSTPPSGRPLPHPSPLFPHQALHFFLLSFSSFAAALSSCRRRSTVPGRPAVPFTFTSTSPPPPPPLFPRRSTSGAAARALIRAAPNAAAQPPVRPPRRQPPPVTLRPRRPHSELPLTPMKLTHPSFFPSRGRFRRNAGATAANRAPAELHRPRCAAAAEPRHAPPGHPLAASHARVAAEGLFVLGFSP
jgi:hypothetical protein